MTHTSTPTTVTVLRSGTNGIVLQHPGTGSKVEAILRQKAKEIAR